MALGPVLDHFSSALRDQLPRTVDVRLLRPLRPDREAQADHSVQHRLRDEELVVVRIQAQVQRAIEVVRRREALGAVRRSRGRGRRELEAEDRQSERGYCD